MNPDKYRELIETTENARNIELMNRMARQRLKDEVARQRLKNEREAEMLKMKSILRVKDSLRFVPPNKFAVGEYITIPANFPHCYRTFNSPFDDKVTGLDRAIGGNPSEMNTVVVKRFEGVLDINGDKWDYIVVENDDEKLIGVRVTDELREANK